jgi:hypothetical protein
VQAAKFAYRVGSHHAGLQTSSHRVAELLASALRDHEVDDPATPANVSIYEGVAGLAGARPVYRVYEGCDHVFTTIDTGRAVAVAAGLLESFLPPSERAPGTLELRALAVVDADRAVLVPRALLYREPALERRLRGTGATVLEGASAIVDPGAGTLLVPTSRLLPAGDRDTVRTRPGRRTLVSWLLDRPDDATTATRAHAAVRALALSRHQPPDREQFDLAAALVGRTAVAHTAQDAFVTTLRATFGGASAS